MIRDELLLFADELNKILMHKYSTLPSNASTDNLDSARISRIQDYQKQFLERKIMPFGSAYDRLVDRSILKHATIPGIQTSYLRYRREMRGWETFDINKLRAGIGEGTPWDGFVDVYIKPFIKADMVKNLADSYNLGNTWGYYVVQAGKKEEVELAISENPALISA